jgi:hypothetical protein
MTDQIKKQPGIHPSRYLTRRHYALHPAQSATLWKIADQLRVAMNADNFRPRHKKTGRFRRNSLFNRTPPAGRV